MRHRYTVALYDEYPVDAQILDALTSVDKSKRQEMIRMFIRAGFSSSMKFKDSKEAMISSIDPNTLSLVFAMMSGSKDSVFMEAEEKSEAGIEIKDKLKSDNKKQHINSQYTGVVDSNKNNKESYLSDLVDIDPVAIKDEIKSEKTNNPITPMPSTSHTLDDPLSFFK